MSRRIEGRRTGSRDCTNAAPDKSFQALRCVRAHYALVTAGACRRNSHKGPRSKSELFAELTANLYKSGDRADDRCVAF
jgi:hypothetical protein